MSNTKPMVQRTRRLAGRRLMFLLQAEDDTLREFAAAAKSGRAAKTLVKQGAQRITLVALRTGTVLPRHAVAAAVSIQTLRGCLKIATDRGEVEVPAGALVAFGPGVPHEARAAGDCAILITVSMG